LIDKALLGVRLFRFVQFFFDLWFLLFINHRSLRLQSACLVFRSHSGASWRNSDSLAHFKEGDLALALALIFEVAREGPSLVLSAPFLGDLGGQVLRLFFHTLVEIEVDLSGNELGLSGFRTSVRLLRHELLVILLQLRPGRIRGDLASIIFGANLTHSSFEAFDNLF